MVEEVVPAEVELCGRRFRLFRSPAQIQVCVQRLAKAIPPNSLVVPLLTGAALFSADLIRYVAHPNLYLAYVKVSSYRGGMRSRRAPAIQGLDMQVFSGEKLSAIFLVDTIADSGRTFQYVRRWVRLRFGEICPIYTVALFVKPRARSVTNFFGEEIAQDLFLVGYGLDYQEAGRNLRAIYALAETSSG